MLRSRKPERIHAFAVALTGVAEADRRLRAAAADQVGLNHADFDTVRYLAEQGPVPAGRIAEAMGITSARVGSSARATRSIDAKSWFSWRRRAAS
jgi:DNA-binding MarR family transcriptional regulator